MANNNLKITFLGTNGWYATPIGNTICTLIETPERYVVLDAGDGIHRLDKYASDANKPIDIFLSHFHLDHIIGLHIQPKFFFKNPVHIYGMPGTKKILNQIVSRPFSAPFEMLEKRGLKVIVGELEEGDNQMDGYRVRTAPLVHADPCWGYRFEFPRVDIHGSGTAKKIVAYCTDTGPCENIVSLARGADALITECSLMPGMPISKSWPHLNPETAAKIAQEAGCMKLYLSHFAANHYDTRNKRETAQVVARQTFENTYCAFDEMEIEI